MTNRQLHKADHLWIRFVSLLVAEAFFFSCLTPTWANPTSMLRPEQNAKDGGFIKNFREELKGGSIVSIPDLTARDGGRFKDIFRMLFRLRKTETKSAKLKPESVKLLGERPSEKKEGEIIETDMTLAYGGLKRWTEERILIDLVQNHLPTDAKGKEVRVTFIRPDGTRIPLKKSEGLSYEDGIAIEISDDGVGYDVEHLKLFLTTKHGEERGQFGEGLKIAITSALQKGIWIETASRGWEAIAKLRPVVLNRGRPNEIRTEQVYFVKTDSPKEIHGSKTVIRNVSPELFQAAKRLADLVLPIRKEYQPLVTVPGVGEIVKKSPPDTSTLYVKGLKVIELPNPNAGFYRNTFFDYNFYDIEIGRDRDTVSSYQATNRMGEIILKGITPQLAELILRSVGVPYSGDEKEPKRILFYDDLGAVRVPYDGTVPNAEVWREAFQRLFGEDAILASPPGSSEALNQTTKQALREGKKLVQINPSLYHILEASGILTDKALYIEQQATMDTSISLDYREEAWGALRILLDGVQNHLREDSGATEVRVEFSVDGDETQWHDLSEIGRFNDNRISAIRIKDNGYGYDVELLGLLWSTKVENLAAKGRFGEGLKMIAAASLREGLEMQLKSRNWQATAVKQTKYVNVLNGKEGESRGVPYLAFNVTRFKGKEGSGSETIFRKLTPNFIKEFRRLPELILSFNPNYQPLSKVSGKGEIKSLDPELFVQGLVIHAQAWQGIRLILGYNLYDRNIIASPDRNVIALDKLNKSIGGVLAETDSVEAIAKVIQTALSKAFVPYSEFQDFGARENFRADVWRQALQRVFGDQKIAMVTFASLNPDVLIELQHMGYRPIQLNPNIGNTLHHLGIPYDHELVESDYEFVEEANLTPEEKKTLALRGDIDTLVKEKLNITFDPVLLKIFTKAFSKQTKLELPIEGFYHRRDNFIGIKRSALSNVEDFITVYLEELSHQLSGAGDYTRELYNFTVKIFVRHLMHDFAQRGVVPHAPEPPIEAQDGATKLATTAQDEGVVTLQLEAPVTTPVIPTALPEIKATRYLPEISPLDHNASLFDRQSDLSVYNAARTDILGINAVRLANDVTLRGFDVAVSQFYQLGQRAPKIYLVGDATQLGPKLFASLLELQDLYNPLIEIATPTQYQEIVKNVVAQGGHVAEVGFGDEAAPKEGHFLSGIGLFRLGLLKDSGVRKHYTSEAIQALEAITATELYIPSGREQEIQQIYRNMV